MEPHASRSAASRHPLRRALRALRRCGRELRRGESAESMVSFALSVSILFGFIFGLTTMCLAFYTYEWISEIAREGARYAIVHGSTCETSSGSSCTLATSDINTYVQNIGFPNVAGGTLAVNTTFPDGGEVPDTDRVEVNVTYTFPWDIPFLGSRNISMSSTSEMYFVQ